MDYTETEKFHTANIQRLRYPETKKVLTDTEIR